MLAINERSGQIKLLKTTKSFSSCFSLLMNQKTKKQKNKNKNKKQKTKCGPVPIEISSDQNVPKFRSQPGEPMSYLLAI
jgi:hypothetical protein